jgi:hypothetical protein
MTECGSASETMESQRMPIVAVEVSHCLVRIHPKLAIPPVRKIFFSHWKTALKDDVSVAELFLRRNSFNS